MRRVQAAPEATAEVGRSNIDAFLVDTEPRRDLVARQARDLSRQHHRSAAVRNRCQRPVRLELRVRTDRAAKLRADHVGRFVQQTRRIARELDLDGGALAHLDHRLDVRELEDARDFPLRFDRLLGGVGGHARPRDDADEVGLLDHFHDARHRLRGRSVGAHEARSDLSRPHDRAIEHVGHRCVHAEDRRAEHLLAQVDASDRLADVAVVLRALERRWVGDFAPVAHLCDDFAVGQRLAACAHASAFDLQLGDGYAQLLGCLALDQLAHGGCELAQGLPQPGNRRAAACAAWVDVAGSGRRVDDAQLRDVHLELVCGDLREAGESALPHLDLGAVERDDIVSRHLEPQRGALRVARVRWFPPFGRTREVAPDRVPTDVSGAEQHADARQRAEHEAPAGSATHEPCRPAVQPARPGAGPVRPRDESPCAYGGTSRSDRCWRCSRRCPRRSGAGSSEATPRWPS